MKDLFRIFEELQEVETCVLEDPKNGEGEEAGDICSSHGQLQGGESESLEALGVLKDLMGTLVSGIKSAPALHTIVSGEFSIFSSTADTATSPPDEAKVVSCTPVSDSRKAGERAAVDGSTTCKHTCTFHAEEMDPRLWSKLPGEVLAHIFARLPLPQIFALRKLSREWSKTSMTSAFRQLWTEAHSKVFGIVEYNGFGEFTIAAFDDSHGWSSKVWSFRALQDASYQDILIAHDGGLICACVRPCTDQDNKSGIIIIVGNPLTNDFRSMQVTPPRTEDGPQKEPIGEPILLQLVVDPTTGSYRVLIVCRWYYLEQGLVVRTVEWANSYDSRTGQWRTLDSGFVFGAVYDNGFRKSFVFDASTGFRWPVEHEQLTTDEGVLSRPHFDVPLIVKDRVYVLFEQTDTGRLEFQLSEFSLESFTAGFKEVNSPLLILTRVSNIQGNPDQYGVKLFASHGNFMLVIYAYDCNARGEDCTCKIQQTRLFDISTKSWLNLPLVKQRNTFLRLQNSFMCELRWDAKP